MTNQYIIEDSSRKIIALLIFLIAIVILTGAGVCIFIDNRPTEIIRNETVFQISKADIYVDSRGRFELLTEDKALKIELNDMP